MAASDPFVLPPLPWPKNSLEPHISAETVEFHYEKHHRGYVTKLNALAKGTALEKSTLEQVVLNEKGKAFNLGAQIWNHTFYWDGLTEAKNSGQPHGKLHEAINHSFGSFDKFKAEFDDKALNHFGSGWVWLVKEKHSDKLAVVETHDAGNPLTDGHVPLLTIDVWEHAYYIDKKNDRGAYIKDWWHVVNWSVVEKRLHG